MAHKLFPTSYSETSRKRNYKLPHFNGKFGLAFMIGSKEIFIGLALNDIVEEKVVRKRFIKIPKGKVSVLKYDPSSL